jgi:DNA-binding NarL/FixJ family response regulator
VPSTPPCPGSHERTDAAIQVLVVDDHRTFGDAMCIAISMQPDMVCRGSLPSAEAALDAIDASGCLDVVLLDVSLPGIDGISAIHALRQRCPQMRIILLTADTTAGTILAAVDAGADGFLPKSHPFTSVLHLVRNVADELVAEPVTLERALRHATNQATGSTTGSVAAELTEREHQILLLLAEGLPVKQVASRLHMSVHTCRGHVAALLRKFDVHSQLAAVVAAAKAGLLPNLVRRSQH